MQKLIDHVCVNYDVLEMKSTGDIEYQNIGFGQKKKQKKKNPETRHQPQAENDGKLRGEKAINYENQAT